jgi:hypothetical protein
MTRHTLRRWFSLTAFTILTVAAMALGYDAGGLILVFGCVGWGILIASAMWWGVASAPAENRLRQRPQYPSMVTYALPAAFMLVPALLALVIAGAVAALCSCWIVVAGMAVTIRVLDAIFGKTRDPNPPRTST